MRKLKMPMFEGEDAYGWIYKVKWYFEIQGLSQQEQLRATALCMEGEANLGINGCEEKYALGHRCTSHTLQVMLVAESDEAEELDINFKSWDHGSKID
ncbi:hypothetical protein Tco_1379609 [Tanacetum coccineum]